APLPLALTQGLLVQVDQQHVSHGLTPCPPLREVLTPLSPSPFGRGGTLSVSLARGVGTTRRRSPRRRERAPPPTRPRREAGHPPGRGSGPARTQRIAETAVAAP